MKRVYYWLILLLLLCGQLRGQEYKGGLGGGFGIVMESLVPAVTLEGTTEVYEGDRVTMRVNPGTSGVMGYTYEWYKDGSPELLDTVSDFVIVSVKPGNAGNYYCVVTDRLGNREESPRLALGISSAPGGRSPRAFRGGLQDGFARGPVNFAVRVTVPLVICENLDTVFRAVVNCTDSPKRYEVEWFRLLQPGVVIGKGLVLSRNRVGISDRDGYYCVATDRYGISVHSDTVRMNVYEQPVITLSGEFRDTTICWQDSVTLIAGHTVDTAKISWRASGFTKEGVTSIKVSPAEQQYYYFKAENHGCRAEDTAMVRINKPYVNLPAIANATEGGPLTLTAKDAGGAALPATQIDWYEKNVCVASKQNPLTFRVINREMMLKVAYRSGSCLAYDSVKVAMKSIGAFRGNKNDGFTRNCIPPMIIVQPTAGERQCVTATEGLDLKVVAEGTGISYRWQKLDPNSNEFVPFTPSHAGVTGEKNPVLKFTTMNDRDNGLYRCVLTNACSWEDVVSDTCHVSVKGEPVILSGINVNNDQCANSGPFEFNVRAVISVGTGSLHYRWYKDGKQISAEADTLKNYYKFTIGVEGKEEGLYVVEVSNACGAVYDTAYLPVVVPPLITEQSIDVRACYNGKAEFWVKTNRDEKYRYALYELNNYPRLDPKQKVADSYTNKITLGNVTTSGYYLMKVYHTTCDSTFSAPIALNIDHPVTIVASPKDTTVCAGGSLTLDVVATTGVAFDTALYYQWYKDGIACTPLTKTSVLNIPKLNYERDTVRFECVASNRCNSARSFMAKVAVRRLPHISYGPSVFPEYCVGDTLRLNVVMSSRAWESDSVRWFYGGSRLADRDVMPKINGSRTLALELDSLTGAYTTEYFHMEAYNMCGRVQSAQVQSHVLDPARFVRNLDNNVKLIMCAGEEQELVVQATGSPAIRYIWTQNDVVVADGYSNRLKVNGAQLNQKDKFTCHIQNTCGDELSTAYISLSKAKEFAFSGGGSVCERDERGISACLLGSDPGVTYQLFRKPSTFVKEAKGDDVIPAYGQICFEKLTEPGEYYVVAKDVNECRTTMPGIAKVERLPLPSDYGFNITRHMCVGDRDGVAELENSELDVEYYLCTQKVLGGWDTLRPGRRGTGAALAYTLGAGTYKIVAENVSTGCSRSLTSIVKIEQRPLPAPCPLRFVNADSVYCDGLESDVKLEYTCIQADHSYQLRKNGADFGAVKKSAPLIWSALEVGKYSVRVTNQWGCKAVAAGSKEVTSQPRPSRYSLVGRSFYCKEEIPGTGTLELTGSDPGVLYSFRYAPGRVFKDVSGTSGGAIRLTIPLEDRDYYVIATDMTPEHCWSAMYDTIRLKQSRLTLVAQSPVTAKYNTPQQLNMTVTGQVGEVTYKWTPVKWFPNDQLTVQNPKTAPVTSNFNAQVTAQDGSGCPVPATVEVRLSGGDFVGEIRDKKGEFSVDTLRLCGGEKVELTAMVSGGSCNGSYTYEWKDDEQSLAGNSTLTPYVKTKDGKVMVKVKCGAEKEVLDTVVVLVNPSPVVDTVADPGLRCVAGTDPVQIVLKNSDLTTYYYLERKNKDIWEKTGFSTYGTGGKLYFSLAEAAGNYGNYRVVGELPHTHPGNGRCYSAMTGEVEFRQKPETYHVGGGWDYCEGVDPRPSGTVTLAGSETGLEYRLRRLPAIQAAKETGTGTAISFTDRYEAGRYVVEANVERCTTVMPDTVDVIEHKIPGIGKLVGDGTHCTTECPVEIAVTQGEKNAEYILTAPGAAPVLKTGTGKVSFGNFCTLGTYTLTARRSGTTCEKEYKTIVIATSPGDVVITGSEELCPGEVSREAEVRIANPELGVVYKLHAANNKSVALGSFVLQPDGSLLNKQTMSEGKYVVVAKVGDDCLREYADTIRIRKKEHMDLPGDMTVGWDGNACVDSSVVIYIPKTVASLTYQLYHNGVAYGTPVPGVSAVNDRIEWSLIPALAGTYQVKTAYKGCMVRVDTTVVVAATPQPKILQGKEEYCSGTPEALWLSGYEADVNYSLWRFPVDTLFRKGVLVSARVEFAKVTEGTFYPVSERGNCRIAGDHKTIKVIPLPKAPQRVVSDCEQAGKGWLTLKNLSDRKSYTFTDAPMALAPVSGYAGDSTYIHLLPGVYTLKIDTLGKCNTVVKDTVREGVALDTLVPPLAYCAGVSGAVLRLSDVHQGMAYSILTPQGAVYETVRKRNNTKAFSRKYPGGQYVFRRLRESYPSGCVDEVAFAVDRPLDLEKKLPVSIIGAAPVCGGGKYAVEIGATEEHVRYVLQLMKDPVVNVDTLFGDSSTKRFGKELTVGGQYKILMTDTLVGCTGYLDTILTIHPLPALNVVRDTFYCIPPDRGFAITVRAMETHALYRLGEVDTLYGPGNGVFPKQFVRADPYLVIAEDTLTGCKDTAEIKISTRQGSTYYGLDNPGCFSVDVPLDIRTTGSDVGAVYYLHRDKMPVLPVVKQNGTGNLLSFGDRNEPGVYQVWAESPNGCGFYLKDSVAFYQKLVPTALVVNGAYCLGGDNKGLELKTSGSVKGWDYYISDGIHVSDTLAGGSKLAWDSLYMTVRPLKRMGIGRGKYTLYAINSCNEEKKVSETEVKDQIPEIPQLVSVPTQYCAPDPFSIVLVSSEKRVDYTVERYDSRGKLEQSYGPFKGTGSASFSLGKYSAPGHYRVCAESGCKSCTEQWEVKDGVLPEVYDLSGENVCITAPDPALQVSLSQRQPRVTYTLYQDGTPAIQVAQILYTDPLPQLDFPKQTMAGCYYVEGMNGKGGCSRRMKGSLCLNEPSPVYRVEPVQNHLLNDTVRVCEGVDTNIWLSNSTLGVGYELLCNGAMTHTATGTGRRLKVGAITENGIYRVRAYACDLMMEDSVVVRTYKQPSLSVESEVIYCEGRDAFIKVLPFTDPGVTYILKNPARQQIDMQTGPADRGEFKFSVSVADEGYYYVEAKYQGTGCSRVDSTKLTMELRPRAFELFSDNGEYICRGGSVRIGVSGSETATRYLLQLRSPAMDVVEETGTGMELMFSRPVKIHGDYYVTATYAGGLNCSTNFGHLSLQLADTLYQYKVETPSSHYCGTAATPQGYLRLSGSQAGKRYYLLRDGVVVGAPVTGTGAPLVWTGLEGKPCDDVSLVEGYVYRVMAQDPVSGCTRNMYGTDTIAAVAPLKLIAREPKTLTLEQCEDTEAKFSVTVTGCLADYTWKRYGRTIKSGPEAFYNIAAVKLSDAGAYECEITNACGSIVSPAVDLVVREKVVLEEPMEDIAVCGGSVPRVMFSSGFRNAEDYRWYKLPDMEHVIGTRDFLEIAAPKVTDAGDYVCVAANRCQVTVNDTVRLILDSLPRFELSELRSDTLCEGEDYQTVFVNSSERPGDIEWFLNGESLNFRGNRYMKYGVTRKDEGVYSVRAVNACGVATYQVATLRVDEPLQVISHSKQDMILCPEETEQLYIEIQPSDRVQYTWVDSRNTPLGHGNTLTVGGFQWNNAYTYRVYYSNRCTSGSGNFRDFVIRTPDVLNFTDPMRDLVLCAEKDSEAELKIDVPATMLAEFEWYYRQKKDDVAREIVGHESAVKIPRSTKNTGFYYCRVYNRCATKTTETSWVRIDSVPVIQTHLADDTICEDGWISIPLTATGGGLNYEWHILKKDGTELSETHNKADFTSTDELTLSNVDNSFDSCLIWSHVYNTCGEDNSDTMVLRVTQRRELTVDKKSVAVCQNGGDASVTLTLVNGKAPWKYRYTIDNGPEVEVTEMVDLQNVLSVVKSGVYQVTYLEDAEGCIRTTGLPSFTATVRSVPTVTIGGGGEVCIGSKVSVSISVTGGTGPWKVYVHRLSDGLLAGEIPNNPLVLPVGENDSTIWFMVVADESYYIEKIEDYYAGEGMCAGLVVGDMAEVKVSEKLNVRFTPLKDNHVGMCQAIDLHKLLAPYVDLGGAQKTVLAETDGDFYIDDKKLSSKWWAQADLKKGTHKVGYAYKKDTCSMKPEIELIVDTLPVGKIDVPGYVCLGGGSAQMTLQLTGAAPFKMDIQKRWLSYGGSWGPTIVRTGVSVPTGSYSEVAGFLSGDSCLYYTVSNIRDKHGCYSSDVLRDTIFQSRRVEFDVDVRYPHRDGVAWQPLLLQYNIPAGDSLGICFTQTIGNGYPWRVMMANNNQLGSPLLGDLWIYRTDTVISLKKSYNYLIRPGDAFCGQNPWDDKYMILNYMDTGYVKAKVLLEGACVSGGAVAMTSAMEPRLPLYGLSELPASRAGHIVDWIEVEVRSFASDGLHPEDTVAALYPQVAVLLRDTCLVLDDGTVVDRQGNDRIALPHCWAAGGASNYCYFVLRHRNHLSVMTAKSWKIVGKSQLSNVQFIDFTKADNIYLKTKTLGEHMTETTAGKWALSVGEVNHTINDLSGAYSRGKNRVITVRDPNIDHMEQTGVLDYHLFDLNFDGQVDWPGWGMSSNDPKIDWILAQKNRDKYTEIMFCDTCVVGATEIEEDQSCRMDFRVKSVSGGTVSGQKYLIPSGGALRVEIERKSGTGPWSVYQVGKLDDNVQVYPMGDVASGTVSIPTPGIYLLRVGMDACGAAYPWNSYYLEIEMTP